MSRVGLSLKKLNDYNINSVFLDADMMVYTFGFAVESSVEWPPDDEHDDYWTEYYSDLPAARRLIDSCVRHFKTGLNAPLVCVLTGTERNWRLDVQSDYKGRRGRKPTSWAEIRDHITRAHSAIISTDGLEADDVLSIEATKNENSVIVSFDKDMFTIPGLFVHLVTKRLYRGNIGQALCFLMFQALTGDRVDGYFGVTGIGPAKAKRLLLWNELSNHNIRSTYLALKRAIKSHKFRADDKNLLTPEQRWKQFRSCLDLAALVWDSEIPGSGIGMRRIWKYRNEKFHYYLPFILEEHTNKLSIGKM